MSQPEDDSENIFEFRTTQCQPFKILFDIIKEFVSSCNIYFTNEGIKIRVYDKGQTQYIDVFLDADNFDHYYYKGSDDPDVCEDVYINVSINLINSILKSINPTDNVLKWSYKNNGDNELKIVINSEKKQEIKEYYVKTNDGEETDDNPPSDIEKYNYILMMPCDDLSNIFKNYKQFDHEYIDIKYINNELSFNSPKKNSNIRASITRIASSSVDDIDVNNLNLMVQKEPKNITCYYDQFKFSNLHNLIKCAKICGKGNNIGKIYLLNEHPIIFEFNIGKLGNVKFYLNALNNEE